MLNIAEKYMIEFKNVKVNFREKIKGFTQRMNHGQKFMVVILQLLLDNLKLLNEDNDSNPQCIDFLDFGKEYRYKIKSDGSIVTQTMDTNNNIEPDCRKVRLDNF